MIEEQALALSPASFGDDAPSGENLEYDSVFITMEKAAQPVEERQMGEAVIEGAEPDYKAVIAAANEILERSHDIRAAVYLATARARLEGFPGYAEAVGYVRDCLEQFWDTCHPQLDADDDDDPTMRVNAVFSLTDPETALRAVRLAPLASSAQLGYFSLRDIDIATGAIAAPADMDPLPDETRIAAAFQDTPDEVLKATLEAARAALEAVKGIDDVFSERLPGEGPELGALLRELRAAVSRLSDEVGEPEPQAAEDSAPAEQGAATVAASAPQKTAVPGAITSPRDVEAAIDRIIDYYLKNEPSSPVPIVLRRARRLVGADFMTILGDLAPGGIDNVNSAGWFEKDGE
jgi:type VI secretion system protein ImpA